MSGSEHTPGPWKPVRSLTCGHLRAEHNYRQDPKEEWTDADLRLIAAAPELLEACRATLVFLRFSSDISTSDLWKQTAAAIKKAMSDD